MVVKDLIAQLQLLIEQGHLNEDDVVLVIGSGCVRSDYIQGISMPKVRLGSGTPSELSEGKKGYSHIGFCSIESMPPAKFLKPATGGLKHDKADFIKTWNELVK